MSTQMLEGKSFDLSRDVTWHAQRVKTIWHVTNETPCKPLGLDAVQLIKEAKFLTFPAPEKSSCLPR